MSFSLGCVDKLRWISSYEASVVSVALNVYI
jgi:hypothetical protein